MAKEVIRGVQGLQEFPFCVLTGNDEHTKQIYNHLQNIWD